MRVFGLIGRKTFFIAITVIFFGVFLFFNSSFAQDNLDQDALFGEEIGGAEGVNQELGGLSEQDPRIIIARIINILLGFLGIIAVSIIMYAGFIWMTSQGDEAKIRKAKDIMKAAGIGLIIILSAFAIVNFIFNWWFGGGAFGNNQKKADPPPQIGSGIGALGDGIIESVYPEPLQKDVPKNTSVMVTFRQQIDPSTICEDTNGSTEFCDCTGSGCDLIIKENVRIYKDGDICDADNTNDCVSRYGVTTDNKTFVFLPVGFLEVEGDNSWYNAFLSPDIQKADGEDAFAFGDGYGWMFQVADRIDLTPPQVENMGFFPSADRLADDVAEISAQRAQGIINVISNDIQVKEESSVSDPVGGVPAHFEGNYNCDKDLNNVSAEVDFSNSNKLIFVLNLSDDVFDSNLQLKDKNNIGCGLTLVIDDIGGIEEDTFWTFSVVSQKSSDFLKIGNRTYGFVSADDTPGANEIEKGGNPGATAQNIVNKLNAFDDKVNASLSGTSITVESEEAGSAGNSIGLSSNAEGLEIPQSSLSGGVASGEVVDIRSRADKPKNAVVQITFNEAILPLSLSGEYDSSDGEDSIVEKTISVATSTGAISGNFEVSNGYKTVEFVTNEQCGVNGCGDKIFCLPGDENIFVDLRAAPLATCGTSGDCLALGAGGFANCSEGFCQNDEGINYPLVDYTQVMNGGVLDAALNSLDGDRDGGAEGPEGQSGHPAYNENDLLGVCQASQKHCDFENNSICSGEACVYDNGQEVIPREDKISQMQNDQGDDFSFSFWTSDKIEIDPPAITETFPVNNGADASIIDPVLISFDKLLQPSTVKSGSEISVSGDDYVIHKFFRLWDKSGVPIDYWLAKEDKDANDDGEIDKTDVFVKHSFFRDAVAYRSQAGSGVKDIYQNCFKPSAGPACGDVSDGNPSCCAGSVESDLSNEGNCP